MSKCLSITIKDDPLDELPRNGQSFLNATKDVKWIYVLSEKEHLLLKFKEKIQSYTPEKYLKHMEIVIDNVSDLGEYTLCKNIMRKAHEQDMFHLESVCNNCILSDKYKLEDFTEEIWRGPGGLNLK